MSPVDFATRRWLRVTLAALTRRYPRLTTPTTQGRASRFVERMLEADRAGNVVTTVAITPEEAQRLDVLVERAGFESRGHAVVVAMRIGLPALEECSES